MNTLYKKKLRLYMEKVIHLGKILTFCFRLTSIIQKDKILCVLGFTFRVVEIDFRGV